MKRLVERALFDLSPPNRGKSYMFDSHSLSGDLVDSLVYHAETSTWSP